MATTNFCCWTCEGLVCECCVDQHNGHTIYTVDDPSLAKEVEKELKIIDFLLNSRLGEDKQKLEQLTEMENNTKK